MNHVTVVGPGGRRAFVPEPDPDDEVFDPIHYGGPVKRFLYRVSVGAVVCWILALLPSPTTAISMSLKNGLVGITAILYLGKLLYDTLFFDRFIP